MWRTRSSPTLPMQTAKDFQVGRIHPPPVLGVGADERRGILATLSGVACRLAAGAQAREISEGTPVRDVGVVPRTCRAPCDGCLMLCQPDAHSPQPFIRRPIERGERRLPALPRQDR